MTEAEIAIKKIEEYEQFIEFAARVLDSTSPNSVGGQAKALLKAIPKIDPLLEAWTELGDYWNGPKNTKQALGLGHKAHFAKFKEIFKDELNGTAKAIEVIDILITRYSLEGVHNPVLANVSIETLEELKTKLEKGGE